MTGTATPEPPPADRQGRYELHDLFQQTFQFRPIVVVTVAFATGIVVGTVPWTSVVLLGMAGVVLIAARLTNRSLLLHLAVVLAFASAGSFRQNAQYNPSPVSVAMWSTGRYVELTGRVVTEPLTSPYHATGLMEAEKVVPEDGAERTARGRVLVRLPLDGGRVPPVYGQRVTVRGRLAAVAGPGNPGVGRPASVYRRQGVFSSLECRTPRAWRIRQDQSSVLDRLVAAALGLRDSMESAFAKHMPGDRAGLLTGLILGGYSGLSADVREQFRRSGLLHIVAASGANVGIVVAIMFFVTRGLLLPPAGRAAVAVLATVLYAVAAGSQPAVVRAAIMACVFLAAPLFDRDRDAPCALATAALASLAYDPANLYDVGFQLSFAIVAGSIAFWPTWSSLLDRWLPLAEASRPATRLWKRAFRGWLSVLALSLTAGAFSAPLTAQTFHAIPVFGIVSNALAAPAVAILMPAALLGWALEAVLPAAGKIVATLVLRPLAEWVLGIAAIVGGPAYSSLSVPSPGWLLVATVYAALAYLAWTSYRHLVPVRS